MRLSKPDSNRRPSETSAAHGIGRGTSKPTDVPQQGWGDMARRKSWQSGRVHGRKKGVPFLGQTFWSRTLPGCVQRENVGRNSLLLSKRVITVWEKYIHSVRVTTGREGTESVPGEGMKGAEGPAGKARVPPPAGASRACTQRVKATGRRQKDVPPGQHRLPARPNSCGKSHPPPHLQGLG